MRAAGYNKKVIPDRILVGKNMKPKLFILKMPFDDTNGNSWFCSHCAMIEGALMVNPHWEHEIEVNRIPSKKPRKQLVDILGVENQWMPVLILKGNKTVTDPVEITQYLAANYGGASPHP